MDSFALTLLVGSFGPPSLAPFDGVVVEKDTSWIEFGFGQRMTLVPSFTLSFSLCAANRSKVACDWKI